MSSTFFVIAYQKALCQRELQVEYQLQAALHRAEHVLFYKDALSLCISTIFFRISN